MYTSLITDAKRTTIQEDGTEFLDVTFEIRNGEEIIDTKKVGFSIDATPEEITLDVQKYTANYEAEIVSREASAEREAEDAVVNATIADIVGKEITPAETPEELSMKS